MSVNIEQIIWDWNESTEGFEKIRESLKRLGLCVYKNPFVEGSTCDSMIISKKKLTKKEIKEESKKMWPDPEEE